MKNILLSFILISFNFCTSQIIKETDFTNTNGRLRIKEKNFELPKVDKQLAPVLTSIFVDETKLKELGIDKLNSMILIANEKIPYQLKNKSTYLPKVLRVSFEEKYSRWNVWIEYTAQNDYGATKDNESFVYFNEDGTFDKIVTL